MARKSHGKRNVLNTICKFCFVSLLELGLGVTTARLPDSKDVSLPIMVRVRVRVRVTITQFPEIEDGKIELGEVWECNE